MQVESNNQNFGSLESLLQDAKVAMNSNVSINSVLISDEVRATSQYPAPKMSEEFYVEMAN